VVEQCSKEGFYGDVSAQLEAKEGCDVYGSLTVDKIPGNLHLAPGHAVQHAAAHVSDVVAFTVSTFNVSHTVKKLVFGEPYPVSVWVVGGGEGGGAVTPSTRRRNA
jgi:endoplasmic reticulum-Golgi intermediate compartment protein 3